MSNLIAIEQNQDNLDRGVLALVPTTPDQRSGDQLPPVVFQITSESLIRLQVFLEGFIRQLTRHKPTSTTASTYRKRGRAFLAWLTMDLTAGGQRLDRACFERFRAFLDRRFANPRTKNGYLVAVRQFMRFLVPYHPGLINTAELITGWSCSRKHTRRHLPIEDAKAFLATLEKDPRYSELVRRRNSAMAYLMIKTGLRTIEVSRAEIQHLQELVPGKSWKLWVHGKGRGSADEFVQILPEVYERIQAYLTLRPGPLVSTDPLFATTACLDRAGNVITQNGQPFAVAGKRLSTRSINRILTEGLILAGVKKPGIVVHSLRHSTPTFALLNDAKPIRVQRMMRHKHFATTEIYVEAVQQMIEGAEEAVTQI